MKIGFIYAHMDDETILSYGTMKKFVDEGHDVYLLTFCGLSSKDQSRSKTVDRLYVYKSNTSFLKGENIFLEQFYDLTLTKEQVDLTLTKVLSKINLDSIITHSIIDNHYEHRLIAQEVLLFSRLNRNNQNLKSLWTIASQTYFQTYNQFGSFQSNVFIDISQYKKIKENALTLYSSCHEIPFDSNDIRSVQSVLSYNKQLGYQTNREYCEGFQSLFEIR